MKRTETVKSAEKALEEQKLTTLYIEKVRELNEKTGTPKKMYVATFGCQMNAHDSENIIGMLNEMGYEACDSEKEADVIVYNTCCVRENAENKVYGNLGFLKKLKEKRPNLKIVVCGCMMQQDIVIDKIKSSYRHVDIIFGTFNIHRFPELLHTSLTTGGLIMDIWETHDQIVEDLPVLRQYKHKASVNIMYGCNNFCSYCIVPYVRGRERSREVEDILLEIKRLADDGVIEVMLLGQNVNSYGKSLEQKTTFAQLLREINKIEGIKRIRFMTSHPKDLSDELIYAIRDCEKICKHIHLPVQSGSTNVLKAMNRKYTKDDYMILISKLKDEVPNIAITTDIIVGFPGETEEDFLETLDVVEKVGYSTAYTFLYSKRTGTPAAVMENQIPEDVQKNRFDRLLSLLNNGIYELNKKMVGTTIEVLCEGVNEQDKSLLSGRTEGNVIVHFRGASDEYVGKLINVEITDCKTFYLIGEADFEQ